ncbi:short-chain dehydrogenase [Plectosphaerella plurivora]|uniref:Short-chain dehydrogenase n=1 Tax=Plectosphaerella plurivora TaxID=936078 RepID=A0A9P8V6G5_9PEZI|nr:short-chain dehydrogenase [Plectosphaerella plurivora]
MASKVIIVTGASRGLGLAITKHLLGTSNSVVLAARSGEQLEALKAAHPKQVAYLAADLGKQETATELAELAVKTFGRIDGLVINHGVLNPMSRLENASIDEWKENYNINVFSGLALIKATLPELKKSKGSVVWVSSGAATGAYTAWAAYGSGKAAANHIIAHLGVEEPDITSIAVGPGRVDTDMQKLIRDSGKDSMAEKDHASFVAAHADGQLVQPEQPGTVIANFVARPEASLSGKFLNWKGPELAGYRGD